MADEESHTRGEERRRRLAERRRSYGKMLMPADSERAYMSAGDLAAAHEALGLSNTQMARVLQIEDRSYRRLLAGKRKISGPIARVVETSRDGWRPGAPCHAGWLRAAQAGPTLS